MDLYGDIETNQVTEEKTGSVLEASNKSTQAIKVLVVDDSSLMRSAIKRLLNNSGLDLDIEDAADGHEALEIVKEKEFDLVVSDIEMPVMDGVEFIKRCKMNSEAKVIVLSSVEKLTEEQKQKIRFFGADGIIGKPRGSLDNKYNEILETLSNVLSVEHS